MFASHVECYSCSAAAIVAATAAAAAAVTVTNVVPCCCWCRAWIEVKACNRVSIKSSFINLASTRNDT